VENLKMERWWGAGESSKHWTNALREVPSIGRCGIAYFALALSGLIYSGGRSRSRFHFRFVYNQAGSLIYSGGSFLCAFVFPRVEQASLLAHSGRIESELIRISSASAIQIPSLFGERER